MTANGYYLSKRVRLTALSFIRTYRDWVLDEMLPKFAGLEQRAENVAKEEFSRLLGSEVADENDDMSSAADEAQQKGLAFYETMSELRQATLNLFAAGLFHLLEQRLADLCHDGPLLHRSQVDPPDDTELGVVADWYWDHFRLNLRTIATWPTVDELRLVANAVKHAEGRSAQKLRERRPALFRDPFIDEELQSQERPLRSPLAGEDFYVTEQVFREYSQVVNRFVEEIAEYFEKHGEETYPHVNGNGDAD